MGTSHSPQGTTAPGRGVTGAAPPGSATILWCDEALLAVNKPAGLSLATRPSEPGAAAARLIEALDPGERQAYGLDAPSLYLVHRLDLGTTGLVLLARDEEAHRWLSRCFSEGRVHRTYLALAWGRPRPAKGTCDWPLGPDRRDRRKMRVDPEGRRAITEYRTAGSGSGVSLLELHPKTGRTHQIRVHLSHAGHPIVGDDFYGGPRHIGVRDRSLREALDPPHLLLHAWRLHLPEGPLGPERIFTAPLPRAFERALLALGIGLPE